MSEDRGRKEKKKSIIGKKLWKTSERKKLYI
jgi:hypothetical protein